MPDVPKSKRSKSRKGKGRRARGDGSIFWSEPRQVFIGRKIIGRAPNGKPLYRQVTGKRKEDVVARLAELGPPAKDITVKTWAASWLEGVSVRASTKENYEASVNGHIVPAIGPLKVVDVTPSRVAALLVALGKKGLEPSTIRKIHGHGRTLFEGARLDGIRSDNPFSMTRRPKARKKAIDPFPPADLRRIASADENLSAGRLISLLAAVGCRLGEASALDVADWNPTAGTIAITKTFHTTFGVGPPKSENGVRTITVPVVARPVLIAAVGSRTNGSLFATRTGERFTKAQVQVTFTRILKRFGMKVRNLHQLRHSVATALIAAGHPIADVAKYLGDSVETIVKTYIHPTGADAGPVLDRIFGP